ncbi:protein ENHANCED DOWNY MILDEW 2-like isoform X3 [Malania oleifera]|uniref:protein ENHANCED DOWNY MILDEW 2-like isoform X3 n=1 Tax=Malania oleifera TaxID=397392 RepID=UPI0025AE9DFA|nr:protein ENHANCED DOWNY MILDEW 2-like isoform X3 [Malania oleifera]
MASSDEEGEIVPDYVTDYHFVDGDGKLIPISNLQLLWHKGESPGGLKIQIFLHGTADCGLQKIFKQVIAWKFELSHAQPQISVLTKNNDWIKLKRPRRSFETVLRTILVTLHCLHCAKKNPEASAKSIWIGLLKTFSSYEVQPSENDLLDHKPLIKEAMERDRDLANSKYLRTFLLETPNKKRLLNEIRKNKFIDDDDSDEDDGNVDDDECDENWLFDTVCALCDNGGELLCCEGTCMRSFHATMDAGAESLCESLGYYDTEVEAIQNFLCKNCQYQQHQCFACGILGSSDNESSEAAEVFSCASATCIHFYHPECIAKLLHPGDQIQAARLKKKIAAGESFTCPAHQCFVCREVENKNMHDLQFAVCRRCPKAYHRKCLPREIAFERNTGENIMQRAWEGLLQKRILIYCMDHVIVEKLGTPLRNHIIFPDAEGKKRWHSLGLLLGNDMVMEKESLVAENICAQRSIGKRSEQLGRVYTAVKYGDYIENSEKKSPRQVPTSSKKPKITGVSRTFLKDNVKFVSGTLNKSSAVDKSKLSLRCNKLNLLPESGSSPVKPRQQDISSSRLGNVVSAKPVTKEGSSSRPLADHEMEKRILALMEKSSSSFNVEEFMKNQKLPLTHECSPKHVLDRIITQGKVEGSVKAVRIALQKLDEGCTIEDAKAVCEPEIINQIIRWKRKLKVYLAPFLYGMCYTSFGRHFTEVEKLKQIVDRLHWYVQNDDMIVDFCCGSNDFSCLMKEKLAGMGKKCSFKNYDLFPSKHDFNFEQRDWMSVCLHELLPGSQLIMGLNPPFGVNASLANKFINKALKFKPKLLILIVPKETERLDRKRTPYDMIWEDEQLLSGKSFYLPGSVDKQDKQLKDWNVNPPPLYLWSRPDWTAKHKAIAQKHGHIIKEQADTDAEKINFETVSNYRMEENHDCYGTQKTASYQQKETHFDGSSGPLDTNNNGKKRSLENLYNRGKDLVARMRHHQQ